MKPLDVKILYSNWQKYAPYEFYLVEPAKAEIYFKGDYVRFKALILIKQSYRPFNLCLPVNACLRAFQSVPVEAKNCKLLRVVFEKQDEGKLEIKEFEVKR